MQVFLATKSLKGTSSPMWLHFYLWSFAPDGQTRDIDLDIWGTGYRAEAESESEWTVEVE